MAAVGASSGAAAADSSLVITFGDFTVEETERVLRQGLRPQTAIHSEERRGVPL